MPTIRFSEDFRALADQASADIDAMQRGYSSSAAEQRLQEHARQGKMSRREAKRLARKQRNSEIREHVDLIRAAHELGIDL